MQQNSMYSVQRVYKTKPEKDIENEQTDLKDKRAQMFDQVKEHKKFEKLFDDSKIIVKQTFSKEFFCDLFPGYTTFSVLMSDDFFLGCT